MSEHVCVKLSDEICELIQTIRGEVDPQALDELRLRYSEEAQQIEILERVGKRSAEEMRLKRLRLEHLKAIGREVAQRCRDGVRSVRRPAFVGAGR